MLPFLRAAFVVFFICSLKSKTQQKEIGIKGKADDSSDDWTKMKWDSILKNPGDSGSSNIFSTEDPSKVDELFDLRSDSTKIIKNKVKFDQNVMNDFSRDEVFVQEKGSFRKRSGADLDDIEPEEENSDIRPADSEELGDNIDSEDGENSDLRPADNEELDENNDSEDDEFSQSGSENSRRNFLNGQAINIPHPDAELLKERSFIFNPHAKPQEQFQNCITPKNETGACRYLQHCLIPTIVSSLGQFMDYVCIIEGRFIGVCCPNLPVSVVKVQDPKVSFEEESVLNENCGISTNTRIVGGSNADPKAWPWMVALISKLRNRFFCGGALINDRYVLTAAHCTFGVLNNEIIARVGEYDFKDDGETHEEYAVIEMKRHGHYNRRTLKHDIALLKLEKPVVFNEFVKTICFPEGQNDYVGETATLAGWGNLAGGGATSDVLQQASLPVISNEECSEGHGLPIPESLICTGSKAGDKGACNGDSGGPLMLLDSNNRWKVIGLVSWGRRGCNPEFPTVYTRVSYYLEWITKHSK